MLPLPGILVHTIFFGSYSRKITRDKEFKDSLGNINTVSQTGKFTIIMANFQQNLIDDQSKYKDAGIA